ncbi:MAG: ThiF family adenylyltransferase [Phycisphaerales bacterium]|nr:ThiF family adenylyltransferase [Phycisphaerales bacterium]
MKQSFEGLDEAADRARFSRQLRLAEIGEAGQRRISQSRIVLVGCGALGSHAAAALARAGVRGLRIIDRDLVEMSNLPRQVLFDEADALEGVPKAVAAAAALRHIDSRITVEAIVADLNRANAEALLGDCDVMIDGCDNYETRYLLNDVAVKLNIPWVYGGCIGVEGRSMLIVPDRSPCLRCVFPEPPPPGSEGTCETVGILGTAAAVIANCQATAALRWIVDGDDASAGEFVAIDIWRNEFRVNNMTHLRREDCPCCATRSFDFLDGRRGSGAAELCGRDAIQILAPRGESLDLAKLHDNLAGLGPLKRTAYFVRADIDGFELSVFPDGRAIIRGTTDPAVARSLYAKYVGH